MDIPKESERVLKENEKNIFQNEEERKTKMKTNSKAKRAATTILILCLTTTALIAFIPTAAANTPTYAFLTISPNPVGVNQETALIMWLDKIEPTTAGPQGSVWQGFQVLVTKPDGTTVTLGPFTADPAAFAYTLYTPDQVGTYTLKFTFPGQQVTGMGAIIPIPINEYYEASSFTTTFTVRKGSRYSITADSASKRIIG